MAIRCRVCHEEIVILDAKEKLIRHCKCRGHRLERVMEEKRKRRYFCSACGEELLVDHLPTTTAVSPCKNPGCLSRLPKPDSTPPPTNQRLEVAIKRLDYQREKIEQLSRRVNRLEENIL